jgi:hypothetical protein
MSVTVQIATLPDREVMLWQTVKSLYNQVDQFYIMLNGHKEEPKIPDPSGKIRYVKLRNEYGDAAKFLDFNKREGFVLTFDDDLTAPPNYCSYLINKYRQLGGIITLHGKVFQRPARSAHAYFRENYHCLHTVHGDHRVDTGGTGVMLLNTKDIKIDIKDYPRPNMADIWTGLIAHNQKVPIFVVEHKAGWLTYLNPQSTIWRSHTKEFDQYQVQVLNSFLK